MGSTTPLKNSKSSIAEFIRDSSIDNISKSFHYPVNKKKIIKYKGESNMSSTSELKREEMTRPRSKNRTKSFIGSLDNDGYIKNWESSSKPRDSVHARHRSDGWNIPLSSSSSHYAKYLKHQDEKSKTITKLPSETYNESIDSNIIGTIKVFNSKRPTIFGSKKYSLISDSWGVVSKRSPSIKFLKKKKIIPNTDVPNSPIQSSSDSLIKEQSQTFTQKGQIYKM